MWLARLEELRPPSPDQEASRLARGQSLHAWWTKGGRRRTLHVLLDRFAPMRLALVPDFCGNFLALLAAFEEIARSGIAVLR